MNRLNRWLSLGLVLTLGFLLGMLGFSLWDKMPSSVERVAWSPDAQWITAQEVSYRFYARRTFYLNPPLKAAWLRLSADNDFILYVNGQIVAQETGVTRISTGLAAQLSDPFQRFNDATPYRLQVPEWLHISNARDWKLAVYVDLTPYLRPGKNAIALEIQNSRKNPRVVVEGAVSLVADSPPINLTTGATPWQVSTQFETHQQLSWFDPDFPAQSWPEAKAIASVQEATYSRLSQHLFESILQGSWITGTQSPQGEVWLTTQWQVPKIHRSRAFIRFAGDGDYALLINGLLVKRFEVNDLNQLHMYEVTNFLKTGSNILAVRLARPLDPDWSATRRGILTPNGALGFILDGWVETDQKSITAPIATDSTWHALSEPIAGWTKGDRQGQPATILGQPDPQEFQHLFEGNAYLLNYPNYLWHQSLWQLSAMTCVLVFAWSLGWFLLGRRTSWWDSFSAGAGLLLPGTLFLIGIGLLTHRYAEAERSLLFVQPQSLPLVLLGFVEIGLLTLLWSQSGRKSQAKPISGSLTLPDWSLWFLVSLIACIALNLATGGIALSLVFLGFLGTVLLTLRWDSVHWLFKNWFKAILEVWSSWGKWFLLILIVGMGFGLRAYNLGFADLEADENTSLDAIRGILRTGFPESASGIWYTRGPAFHYMVALWLRLVGNLAVNARFLSVLWGTATLVIVFIFTRQVTGKVWIALVVTAILAIDPLEIWYSRMIRFYQVVQFLTLFSFWSFFKGFIDEGQKKYQYLFFIGITFNLLNQEVTITLLPGFLIGFLFFYRPIRLSRDWSIGMSSVMTMGILFFNIVFFTIKCLTPAVAISESTASYLRLHLSDITGFIVALFVGPNRMHTLYSLFLFLGFVYFLKQRNGKLIFLFSSVFINILVLTILLYQIATRYTYAIYPLFIMLAVYSAVCIMESLGRRMEFILEGLLPLRAIAIGCIVLLFVSNIEPGRVLAGYQDAITVRNTQIAEYIRDRRQPGDVVVTNASAVYAITGGIDYYLPHRLSIFDAVYWHEGRVLDRWGGGVLVNNFDQMSQILQKSNRVWIHLVDRQPPKNTELTQVYNSFQLLGQPALDTFGARLRLWEREDGLLPRVPNEGKDLGAY